MRPRAASSAHLRSGAGGCLAPTAARLGLSGRGPGGQELVLGTEPRAPRAGPSCPPAPWCVPSPGLMWAPPPHVTPTRGLVRWDHGSPVIRRKMLVRGACRLLRLVLLPLPCPSRVLLPAAQPWSTSCGSSGSLPRPAPCVVLPAGRAVLARVQSPQS